MKKAFSSALAYLVGLTLIAGPVRISMYLAERQSVHIEAGKAQVLADDVMRRSEETGQQGRAAAEALAANRAELACSPDEIALMRQLAISSSYLQGVGRGLLGQMVARCRHLPAVALRHSAQTSEIFSDEQPPRRPGPANFEAGVSARLRRHLLQLSLSYRLRALISYIGPRLKRRGFQRLLNIVDLRFHNSSCTTSEKGIHVTLRLHAKHEVLPTQLAAV